MSCKVVVSIFEFPVRHYFCLKMCVTSEPLSLKVLNKKKSVIYSCIPVKYLLDIYLPILTDDIKHALKDAIFPAELK